MKSLKPIKKRKKKGRGEIEKRNKNCIRWLEKNGRKREKEKRISQIQLQFRCLDLSRRRILLWANLEVGVLRKHDPKAENFLNLWGLRETFWL